MKRCFVVGCPRSGTTLLQTMLAQHPSVFTIPESHFFEKIQGRFGGRAGRPFVSPRAAAKALASLVEASGADDFGVDVPRWWLGSGRYAATFLQVLDEAAEARGATVWVEKSPVHLHYVDFISRHVPDANYVHVLRDGRDVVASLLDLCERDPARWVPQLVGRKGVQPKRVDLIDGAVARWNEDLAQSLAHMGEAGHMVTCYEDLIDDLRPTLERICSFLGIEYHPDMEHPRGAAAGVVGPRSDLPHMEKVFQPIEDRRLRRFQVSLRIDERERVTTSLCFGGDPRTAVEGFTSSRDCARPGHEDHGASE